MAIKLTEHKTGLKMERFLSLNTCTACNNFCQSMQQAKETICAQCYGAYMERRYPRARASWTENFKAMTTELLTPDSFIDSWRLINKRRKLSGVRIHSVGEIYNDTDVKNLALFISGINVDIPVTMWTKRIHMLTNEFTRLCTVIYSNSKVNTYVAPVAIDSKVKPLHTFNVYDNEEMMHKDMYHARIHEGIPTFECRGSCKDCMVCYPKQGEEVKGMAIFELTKRAQGKAGGKKAAI